MKYSIVTCTFNAELHLSKYLENIDEIDYDSFEVIVVDDFSKDNTYLRLTEYSQKTLKNVRVYRHTVNQGPGVARNTGLQYVTGKKVVFVDVDDYVDKDLFRFLDNYCNNDIVVFDYYKRFQGGVSKLCSTLTLQEGKVNDIEQVLMTTNGCVWGKLFDTSIIKNNEVFFPHMLKSEDLVFVMTYLSFCKTAYYLKQPLYYYSITPTSLVHRNIENQVKYAYEAIAHIRRLNISETSKMLFFCREIIYDLTIIYIRIGKNRKFLNEFWDKESLPHNWRNLKDCFTRIHYLFLYLIDNRCYYSLRLLIKVKNILS